MTSHIARPAFTCAVTVAAFLAACSGETGTASRPAAKAPPSATATAPATPGTLRGTGTATVDGVLAPGEWDGAAVVDLLARVPANDGGGTVPLRLLFMDDGVNLQVAVQVARAFGAGTINPVYEFDGDLDGRLGLGDDGFGGAEARWSPLSFSDTARTECPGVPPGTGLCGPADTDGLGGLLAPGTTDGGIAAAGDATSTVLELWHPLCSGDPRDFCLSAGDAVGVIFTLRLFSDDSSCNSGETCYADTPWPTTGSAPLVITGGAPPPPEPPPPPPPPHDGRGDTDHGDGHQGHHHGHHGHGSDHHDGGDGDGGGGDRGHGQGPEGP
jgi:hypothetical protein